MTRLTFFTMFALISLLVNPSIASIVTYSFTGSTSLILGQPYGMTIPSGTSITGQFQYDTSTVAASTSGNLSIYPQSIPNGFYANFGSYSVNASNYTVHIVNDQPEPGNTVADIFTVEWASNDTPTPATPLNANGISQSTGIFSISLFYGSGTFSDTSLPASIPITGFNGIRTSFLSHVTIPLDVMYNVNTVTAVPEPSSWVLGIIGPVLFGIGCYIMRQRRGFAL